jgi:hypothetical protein
MQYLPAHQQHPCLLVFEEQQHWVRAIDCVSENTFISIEFMGPNRARLKSKVRPSMVYPDGICMTDYDIAPENEKNTETFFRWMNFS